MTQAVTPGVASTAVCEALKRRRKPLVILPGQAADQVKQAELERLQAAELHLAQQNRETRAQLLHAQARIEELEGQLATAKETIGILEKDAVGRKGGKKAKEAEKQPAPQQPQPQPEPEKPQNVQTPQPPEQPQPNKDEAFTPLPPITPGESTSEDDESLPDR